MDVNLTPTGPPETVLPEPEAGLIERIEAAGSSLAGLSSIVAEHPESLFAWAALGEAIEEIGSDFETGVRVSGDRNKVSDNESSGNLLLDLEDTNPDCGDNLLVKKREIQFDVLITSEFPERHFPNWYRLVILQ